MQLMRTIGMARGAEEQLAYAFSLLTDRHGRDADIRDGCAMFARWSNRHVAALEPASRRHGEQLTEHPLRVRSGLFYGTRMGGLGLLQDLQDLALLAHQARTAWTVLAQSAAELHDKELQRVCLFASTETDRQIAWTQTHIKQLAPQTQTVTPHRLSEMRASLPLRPTIAAVPDGLWGPVMAAVMLLVTGLIALLVGEPWLVPSLGPTAYLQAESPAQPSSRLYNVVVGHLVGLLVGFLIVWVLAVRDNAVPLTSGDLTSGRVVAAVLALGISMLVANVLHASHPPAGATTLLVALGSIHNSEQALYLMLGVVVLGMLGELIRHMRLGDLKTIVHSPRRRELLHVPRLPRVLSPHG